MLLVGRPKIAEYCKVSITTIDKWKRNLHFPIVRGIDGKYSASTESIKLWLKAYMTVKERKQSLNVKPKIVKVVKTPQGKMKVREASIRQATEKLRASRWKPAGASIPRPPLWNPREKQLSKNLNLSPEPPSEES